MLTLPLCLSSIARYDAGLPTSRKYLKNSENISNLKKFYKYLKNLQIFFLNIGHVR